LKLPVLVAPMFLVSGQDIEIAGARSRKGSVHAQDRPYVESLRITPVSKVDKKPLCATELANAFRRVNRWGRR
jgi:hypothetical protein